VKTIDYRPEDPTHCEVCGAELVREEERGLVYIGIADVEWAQEYGVEVGEQAETIWYFWHCPVDPEFHPHGPIVLASV
jgi:uncharacterized protein YcsI (UPF0317 family)